MIKQIIKSLVILVLVLPVLFFLNTGFSTDVIWKTFQTIGFSAVFSLSLVWPISRRYFLILSGLLFIFMASFFIFGRKEWAEILGSTAFGLVTLWLISVLPQIVKRGYVHEE